MAAPRRSWRREEVAWLIENYAELGPEECSEKLGRSNQGVRSQVRRLRAIGVDIRYLPSANGMDPEWNRQQVEMHLTSLPGCPYNGARYTDEPVGKAALVFAVPVSLPRQKNDNYGAI